MLWVNIDIPLKRYVIHASRTCTYVVKKFETHFKGINELKRDGGWLTFESKGEALARYGTQFRDYDLIDHCKYSLT